ncbi:MAG: HipA domain-containing protein [Chitinispirillaceae bacterium]|nr:HipA domain-containing protein [Chitinispirillaceae bacterium]
MADCVIKLPQGRSLRYAVTCNAFGANDRLPLVMVDANGISVVVAHIRPLAHGGFFVEAESGMPEVFLGNSGKGVFDDLPYFLYDLCPQGFIGRQIALEMASRSDDFPSDPRLWNANHIGRYLISNGDDLPGNLKLGDQAFLRIRNLPVPVSDEEYPELADSVMNGAIPGSSAGGEQPKFTAFSRNCSSHVIVKFSPMGSNSVALRWRDILITEHHAAQTCHQYQLPAAETRLLDRKGRLFLEARRFDRAGVFGRLPMISLKAIDREFTGLLSNWPLVMNALLTRKLVKQQHVDDVTMLWLF